ncbi:MAG: beta-ketoacyl-ACP synthase III [Micavibrio sp.]|nr:MAG: beta-ketoacyl-ACP synthase III [Micavibrio sp.]
MKTAVISGTGLYTPPHKISNEELVTAFNEFVERFNTENAAAIAAGEIEALQHSSAEFIEKASGVKSRFVMDKKGILDPERLCPIIPERSNDNISVLAEIGIAAAKEAINNAGLTAQDIDGVIVAASNMQRPYPAMAIEIQNALGIEGFGFDMNVACSSATFGLQTACDIVRSGSAQRVLMVNPEICSGHLNFRDRDSHFIFGDVATAVIIETADTAKSDTQWEVLGTRLRTSFSNNIRNNFGFLNRCDESGIGKSDKLFVQEGRKVFKEVVPMVADLITGHLSDTGLDPAGLRRIWLHQANIHMNIMIAKKVFNRDIDSDTTPIILDEYANTSSAGSIIAFHKYSRDMQAGDTGLLCSFGAGYSAGSIILRRR